MAEHDTTPHLKQLNEQLNDIRKHLGRIEKTHDVASLLRDGFKQIIEETQRQTDTSVEMTIILVQSELEALTQLLEEERSQVQVLIDAGEQEIAMQKQVYDGSIAEVSADRNHQVGKLLQPIFEILGQDGDDHIGGRYEPVVSHLESFGAALSEQIGEREDTIRELFDKVTARVREFAESRRQIHDRIARYSFPAGEGAAAETLSVPFYVVHRRDRRTGQVRAELIPPSTVEESGDELVGHRLTSLPHLEEVARELENHLPDAPETGETVRAADLIESDPPPGGPFASHAHRILHNLLDRRKIRLG